MCHHQNLMAFSVKKIANTQPSNIKLLQNNTMSMLKPAVYMGSYDVIKKRIYSLLIRNVDEDTRGHSGVLEPFLKGFFFSYFVPLVDFPFLSSAIENA